MPYDIASYGVIIFMIFGFTVFVIMHHISMQKLNDYLFGIDPIFFKQIKAVFSNRINGFSIFYEKERFMNHHSIIIRELYNEVITTIKYVFISFFLFVSMTFLLMLNVWK